MADLLVGLGWAVGSASRYAPVLALLARGTVLLMLVYGLSFMLRRRSPGLRHLLWSGALTALLLLPALGAWLPPLRVLPWHAPAAGAVASPVALASSAAPSSAAPVGRTVADAPIASPAPLPKGSGRVAPASCANCDVSATPSSSGIPDGFWLLVLWAGGVALLMGRMLYGSLSLRRIVRGSVPLESPDWTHPLYEAADILGLQDAPRLLMSDAVQLPFTARLLKPVVVLPASAAAWSEDRRRAVLSHELAHVRRRDLTAHLLGRLACAVYWIHPLVWLAAKRARDEGERACDDMVLLTGARASAYADHLLQIVCAAARTSAPAVAIPMAQRTSFEGRMLAILEPARRSAGPGRAQVLGTIAGLALLVAGVAAAAPAARQGEPGARASAPPSALARTAATAARPAPAAMPETTVVAQRAMRQDTGRARRPGAGGLSDLVSTTVSQTLANLNLSVDVQQATSGARSGDGRITPTPMPMPTPAPMVFDGRRSGPPHRAERHHARKTGDAKVVAALIHALGDDQADVRAHAAYALGEIGDPAAIPPLSARLRSDADAEVRRMAAWSLSEIDDDAGAPALAEAVRSDRDVGVRRMATFALGNTECGGQEAAVGEALVKDSDAEVRASAAWALGQCSAAPAAASLARALEDASPRVRRAAAWALGELGVETAPAPLIPALRDADPGMRQTAAWALGQIGDEHASPALAAALKDANAEVRKTALWALGRTGGAGARDALLEAIRSDDPVIRRYAAQALAEIR